jgi:hypothetical protein
MEDSRFLQFHPAECVGLPGSVSFSARDVHWDGDLRFVDAGQVATIVKNNSFYPAMAVFMEGKPINSHSSAIKQLQAWWTDAVTKASTIGIIGVHPNLADSYIWAPLATSKARIVVIGDPIAYTEWHKSNCPAISVEVVGNRFAQCLDRFVNSFCS